jgi:pyruvate/oxaloacetate carboxyltransferase
LADGIDPRLSSEADWPALEATLTALEETGYDIEHQLPRLAAVPLPEHRPALELQYRLLAEAQLPISEPTTQSQPIPGDDASSEPVPIQPTHDHRWGPSR